MNKIIEQIKNLESQNRIVVCIRHSNRDAIPKGEFGNEVLLNEKGISNALNFGKELKEIKISTIYTSPIRRCIQTAEKIKEGALQNIEIITKNELGNPGLHITDADLAGRQMIDRGFFPVYYDYISSNCPIGIQEKSVLKNNVIQFFEETIQSEGITLYVTHDAFISFFEFAYCEKKYNESNWIDYLEGFILKI